MGKILVFLFDGVTDYEITFVSHLLNSDAGMDVVTVSYDGNFITEKSGLTYKVDKQLKDFLFGKNNCQVLEGVFSQYYGSKSKDQNRNQGLPFIKDCNNRSIIKNLCVLSSISVELNCFGYIARQSTPRPLDGKYCVEPKSIFVWVVALTVPSIGFE